MKKRNLIYSITLILVFGFFYYVIPNDLKTTITLKKNTYKIGEVINVQVTLENNGFKPLKKKYSNGCGMTFIQANIIDLENPDGPFEGAICTQPDGLYTLKPGDKEIKEFEFKTEENKSGIYTLVVETPGKTIEREVTLEN